MTVLSIVEAPDAVLRKKAKTVKKVDKKIKKLISDMHETLSAQEDPEGVGLAAPQVDKSLRIFVIHYKNRKMTVINPKILSVSKFSKSEAVKKADAKGTPLEGCLSVPHHYGPVTRPKKIELEYTDEKGEKVKEAFTGFMAQIVAHEVDHLNGKLFVDHILEQQVPIYRIHGNEWEEVELA